MAKFSDCFAASTGSSAFAIPPPTITRSGLSATISLIVSGLGYDLQAEGQSPLESLRTVKSVIKNSKVAVAGGIKPNFRIFNNRFNGS
jgi:hypothetical protein